MRMNTTLSDRLEVLSSHHSYVVQYSGVILQLLFEYNQQCILEIPHSQKDHLKLALESVVNAENVTSRTDKTSFVGHSMLVTGIRYVMNEMKGNTVSTEGLEGLVTEVKNLLAGRRYEGQQERMHQFIKHCVEGIEEQCKIAKEIVPVVYKEKETVY